MTKPTKSVDGKMRLTVAVKFRVDAALAIECVVPWLSELEKPTRAKVKAAIAKSLLVLGTESLESQAADSMYTDADYARATRLVSQYWPELA